MTLKQYVSKFKTQREAAVKLGIPESQLNRYLNDVNVPSRGTIALWHGLGIDIEG